MTETDAKYMCECCNYKCNYLAHWTQHINSDKHMNDGKRKPRSDKVFNPQCQHCEYKTTRNTNMKLHYLNHHSDKEERKKKFKYYCEECDFGHFTKALYKAHLEAKHNLY